MISKRNDKRCKSLAKSGKRCRAAATEGGLCFFHANPNKAAQLGRIGGQKNRRVFAESMDPLPCLEKAVAVRDMVARLITEIYTGKLEPRIGAGLAPLLNLQLRSIETSDLERRLATVENLLAETENQIEVPELDFSGLPGFVHPSKPREPSPPNGSARSG